MWNAMISSLLVLATLAVPAALAQQVRLQREFNADGAKRLVLNLQVGAATMTMTTHKGPPMVRLDISHASGSAPKIDYAVVGGDGRLNISSGQGEGQGFSILGSRKGGTFKDTWTISLSRDLPCNLDVEFGLGSGQADFGGLNIEELKFATGLSEVELNFSTPCQGEARNVELATGLGSMEVRGLSNLRMKRFQFAGGLGSAVLEFSGQYRQSLDVTLDVGMGSLDLRVPENIGVKIRHDDNFLSSHEFDRLERTSSDTWFSSNWREGPGNLSLQLSVGMGSVDLEWIPVKGR